MMKLRTFAPMLATAGLLAACQSPADTNAQMAAAAPAPAAAPAMAMTADPMVGGAAMFPSKTIVENAVKPKDHTTLVAAVKAAGLVDTLQGAGPFTVFAPTNEAFDMLPKGTVPTLLKPANKPMLVKVLTYHVVPGRLDGTALTQMIKDGGGQAVLTTVEGEKLIASADPAGGIDVTDAKGGTAMVTTADVYQSNGVIHVVNHVLLP